MAADIGLFINKVQQMLNLLGNYYNYGLHFIEDDVFKLTLYFPDNIYWLKAMAWAHFCLLSDI